MAFTFDTSTNRGKVRRNIGDGISSAYWYEDTEIDNALSEGGSVTEATRILLRGLLANKALRVKRASLPGLTYDDTAQIHALQSLLSMYGGDIPTVSVVMPAVLDFDRGFIDPTPTV